MRRFPADAPILTAAQMRAAEEAAFASGVSQPALMERAGSAVAVQVARLAADRPILVLAGPGNNGGDARIVARWLSERRHDVILAQLSQDTSDLAEAPHRPVLVDGLFGIGLTRPLAADVAAQLARLRAGALTIAIDLPSGLGTDDGADLGTAGADVTVALGALKPAHASALCGHVLLDGIGLDIASDTRTLARPVLTRPAVDSHKFTRGMVAVLAGPMPGAARLAARAALAGGAGYVVLACADGGPDALVHCDADGALADDRVGALVVGPGLGKDRGLLDRALASGRRLVIDGDALSLIGREIARLAGIDAILTPHAAEFERMFGTGPGNKIDRTRAAAQASGCTIVHKGADTVIAHPDGRVTVAADAPAWLASAGTGDVLAGLIAARMAAGDPQPAESAVWLHGRAARFAGPGLIADDLIGAITDALK